MRPCHQVEIVTPKKIRLNGIWYGSYAPKRVIVFIHGLSGSVFSKTDLMQVLAVSGTGVLVFNNRGHDRVSSITSITGKRIIAGAAHEVFEECVDDIDGAISFAKQFHVPVYLMGSSTGCQKISHWAYKRKKGTAGLILLAPISDFSAELMLTGRHKLDQWKKMARILIQKGRQHTLVPIPNPKWEFVVDAQRFMSLYSGKSAEEIFTYWEPKRASKTLRSIKIPTLVLLAEKDEYAERSVDKISSWFEANIQTGEVIVVPRVTHNFKTAEKQVAGYIRRFMKESLM